MRQLSGLRRQLLEHGDIGHLRACLVVEPLRPHRGVRRRPASDGQGLNITVQSDDGKLDFGFIADRELVPDVWLLTEFMHESMDELLALT